MQRVQGRGDADGSVGEGGVGWAEGCSEHLSRREARTPRPEIGQFPDPHPLCQLDQESGQKHALWPIEGQLSKIRCALQAKQYSSPPIRTIMHSGRHDRQPACHSSRQQQANDDDVRKIPELPEFTFAL
ncbi:hypothetical protein SKAU_G00089070 [Synaphobranchus kaupii]|uniref:Uncharacterized protein n=1 Tax=Synaphobranchus kaupii TaxID=118154 RepID=A0A9Q1FWV9_SYNKA|nr:hypothetical protein SKAU_G00089070 [Synaphobranchus kaupii]